LTYPDRAQDISLEDLRRVGNNPIEILKLLADRWTQFQNTLSKSAVLRDIVGRDIQSLVPLLEQGAAGVERLRGRFAVAGRGGSGPKRRAR
jgi:hypothetical protein